MNIEHAVYEDAMKRILELAKAVSSRPDTRPELHIMTFVAPNGSLHFWAECGRLRESAASQLEALRNLEVFLRAVAEKFASRRLDARCEPSREALRSTALPADYWQKIFAANKAGAP